VTVATVNRKDIDKSDDTDVGISYLLIHKMEL